MKERGVAEALVRERLPRRVVRQLRGPPVLLSESFIDETLKGTTADLVMQLPMRRRHDAFVYCVVEHKRVTQPRALVQVLRYLTAVYAWLDRKHRVGPLPPVVPIVIFNGAQPWRGAKRFRELLDDSSAAASLSVDFGVTMIDLRNESLYALSRHPTLRGGLLALKAAAVDTAHVEPVLDEMLGSLRERSTAAVFLRYLHKVLRDDGLKALKRAVRRHAEKEPKMRTIEDMLIARGERRGRKTGRNEGRSEGLSAGREETLRTALRKLLRSRFKRLPAGVDARLLEANAVTLERWFDAALTAKTARAVFADS